MDDKLAHLISQLETSPKKTQERAVALLDLLLNNAKSEVQLRVFQDGLSFYG